MDETLFKEDVGSCPGLYKGLPGGTPKAGYTGRLCPKGSLF